MESESFIKKYSALLLVAFIGSVGAFLGTSSTDFFSKLFDTKTDLNVTVIPYGEFYPGSAQAAYKIVPFSALNPKDLNIDTISHEELIKRFDSANGLEGSAQFVRLELRSNTPDPVIIQKINVEIVGRSEPSKGWFLALDGGCGASYTRVADADLDELNPEFKINLTPDEWDTRESPVRALEITNTEIEILELHVSSSMHTIEWYAEIIYSGKNGKGSITIDNQGKPFKFTTEVGSTKYSLSIKVEDGKEVEVIESNGVITAPRVFC